MPHEFLPAARRLTCHLAVAAGLVWTLAACTSVSELPRPADADASAEASPEAGWQPYVLPGKRATQYRFTTKEGRWAIEARADGSASMLRRTVDMPAETLAEMGWSWWVDAPLAQADLADIDRTDAPASIVLAFDGDKSRLPARARMLFDLARALTGEEPPYATLVYAWATETVPESVVKNPRSDRIRKIIVESGAGQARSWRDYRRNLVQDYERAFGEPPGRLIGVAVMTDADNTRSQARAWYGKISFYPPAAPPAAPGPACGSVAGTSCSRANN
ncbi:MAG: DUF3047 domain-containing protein [Rubrivivax sp.]|nr:DUF3047 domain-containing protein [Rubrivivax sp.]